MFILHTVEVLMHCSFVDLAVAIAMFIMNVPIKLISCLYSVYIMLCSIVIHAVLSGSYVPTELLVSTPSRATLCKTASLGFTGKIQLYINTH